MSLKRDIIGEMNAQQMRGAVRELDVSVDSYRDKHSLVAGLRRSRKATPTVLLEFLSEKDVKRLCVRRGIDSKGRRKKLIARLVESRDRASGSHGPQEAGSRTADTKAKRRRGRKATGRKHTAVVPDLQFGVSSDPMGFTPAGIAAFSDLRPAAVVRELIQNSLDAAVIEAGEPCARVRFERRSCALDDIPGIDNYRTAFQRATEQHKPTGGARAVVQRIERALAERAQELLCVTDNGVGLDRRRMSALLSDGINAKSGGTAGTFGNGHSVVIPASNLRYVLYGGVTEDGESYGAGQAVLASHRIEDEIFACSGRGVYVESFERSAPDVPFTFAQGDDIPPMIATAIERIRAEHGHGAAVIVPAFNNFVHDQSLQDAVYQAAAFNFSQAIHEGRLVVEVEDSGRVGVLDDSTLAQVLAPHREEIRSRRTGAFLSGRKANQVYEVLVEGESRDIETSQGDVAIRLLRRETGRPSVGLCRNGMWITDELPMFQNAFTDRQPFQALILLTSERKNTFFELIQEAETPLHDKLAPKQMEPDRRGALRQALREVRDHIAELVPASADDVYSPDGILSFQFDNAEAQGRGGRQPSFWGQIGPARRSATTSRQGAAATAGGVGQGGGTGGSRKNRKGRVVVEPIFRIALVPTSNGRRSIHVECAQDFDDAELRVFVDENVDATCDRQTRQQAMPVALSNITVGGQLLDEHDLVRDGEAVVGARLGTLAADSRVVVEADCAIPVDSIRTPRGRDPALRVEVLSTLDHAGGGGESADG